LKWRVSDQLWERLAPLLCDPPRRFRSPGRLRYPPRACLEGILYVLVDASLVDAKKGAKRSRARSVAVLAAAFISP
jgi:hypothetical protein